MSDTKEIRSLMERLNNTIDLQVDPEKDKFFRNEMMRLTQDMCNRINELENMLAEMLDDEADSATWAKAINVLEGE